MRRAILSSGAAIAIAVACGGTTVGGDGGANDGGPSPDVTACKAAGECVIVPHSCCGQCGAATKSDMEAINATKLSAYRQSCAGTPCPACFMQQDPNLQAVCVAGACKPLVVNADAMSACTTSADCQLRFAECCECGATGGLIALAKGKLAAYHDAICAPDATCGKCLPLYPADAVAVCNTSTGHCEVGKALADAGAGG